VIVLNMKKILRKQEMRQGRQEPAQRCKSGFGRSVQEFGLEAVRRCCIPLEASRKIGREAVGRAGREKLQRAATSRATIGAGLVGRCRSIVVWAASGMFIRPGMMPGHPVVAAVMEMRLDLGNCNRSIGRTHMAGVPARNRGQKETDYQCEPCRESHACFSR
jgi:hypothetical protein